MEKVWSNPGSGCTISLQVPRFEQTFNRLCSFPGQYFRETIAGSLYTVAALNDLELFDGGERATRNAKEMVDVDQRGKEGMVLSTVP